MRRKSWTQEEIDIIIKYYPTEGIGVLKRLPGRTKTQVYGIAWHHNIKNENRKQREQNKYPRKQYTEDELIYIRQHFYTDTIDEIALALERTPNAIHSIVFKLGLLSQNKETQQLWSEEEMEIVKTYFPLEGIKIVERLPNRSVAAIYSEASHLGVALNKRKQYSSNSEWSKEEDDIIIKHYQKDSVNKCCELLPSRSKQAIIMRANSFLKIKKRTISKWTEEEEKFMFDHYLQDGIDYCDKHLNRTKDSIFQKAIRLGLQTTKKRSKKKKSNNQ